MWNYLVELSIMSGGLIPLMALLLLTALDSLQDRVAKTGIMRGLSGMRWNAAVISSANW